MKKCPNCNEMNGDNNTKCFKCGANLPVSIFKDERATTTPTTTVTHNTANFKKNSEKITTMAIAVCIIGIILAIILGFVFQIPTIQTDTSSLYSDYATTKYSFNLALCVSTIIGTICFAIILTAMSYIAKTIEEK